MGALLGSPRPLSSQLSTWRLMLSCNIKSRQRGSRSFKAGRNTLRRGVASLHPSATDVSPRGGRIASTAIRAGSVEGRDRPRRRRPLDWRPNGPSSETRGRRSAATPLHRRRPYGYRRPGHERNLHDPRTSTGGSERRQRIGYSVRRNRKHLTIDHRCWARACALGIGRPNKRK